MTLDELFVSHKLVEPVSFTKDTPELPKTIYLNLDRAHKAATVEPEEKDDINTWNADKSLYNWSVGYSSPVKKEENTKVNNSKQELTVPYREGVTPSNSKLLDYRSGKNENNYKNFRLELDIFITNNPKYESIKEHLDYLAALESRYNMGVENHLGSRALGWFLFMDGTRAPYNKLSRKDFANDGQSQLLAAAKYYTDLQNNIKKRGGDPNDFVTMYGAWWRPESAYAYLKDNTYDYETGYNESLSKIRQRAKDLIS